MEYALENYLVCEYNVNAGAEDACKANKTRLLQNRGELQRS